MKLSSGKNFKYKVLDSRTIEIYSDILRVDQELGSNGIKEIQIGDLSIKIDDEIEVNIETIPSKYKIRFIKKGKKGFVYVFTHLRNKTTEYLLPCLGGNKAIFYYDSYLINAYLEPKLTNLWLRYRFSKHNEYQKLEKFLTSHECFIKTRDVDFDFVDYKFGIPTEFLDDVPKFINGKYSSFSVGLKLNMGRFHDLKPRSRMLQVLNKDENLKKELEKRLGISVGDIDLDDRPDMSLEFLE